VIYISLPLNLNAEERKIIEKHPTDNLDAYDLYLLGRHYWQQHTTDSMGKACDYFLQAIDKDPNFALAYTGVADFYNQMGLKYDPALYEVARAASEKALEIDDTIAEAHVSLAWVKMYYDWEFGTAEKALKRAIELNPGYYLAHQWYTDYLLIMRQHEKALVQIKQAEELNPQYYPAIRLTMDVYMLLERYDEAIKQFQKLKELNHDGAYYMLAKFHTYQGNYDKALEVVTKELDINYYYLIYVYTLMGERDKAKQLADTFINRIRTSYSSNDIEEWIDYFQLQRIETYFPSIDSDQIIQVMGKHIKEPYITAKTYWYHTAQGNIDKAISCLETYYEMRSTDLLQTVFLKEYENLHQHPRYKALIKKVGLPE